MKKGAKRITLVDRVKRAIDAFRGKPNQYVNIGIDVKKCNECDFKNREEEVAYLCDRKQCEVCCYPECSHTTDICHAKNFVDNFEIDACAECNNMYRELIKDLADQLEDAHETIESLDRRLKHLLQSKFIRSFDEHDPKTHTYKRDIKLADDIKGYIPSAQSIDPDAEV